MLLLVLLFLTVRGLEQFVDADQFRISAWLIQTFGKIEQPALEWIRGNLPTKYKGLDVSRWILLTALVLLWGQISWLESELSSRVRRLKPRYTVPPPPGPAGLLALDPNLDREKLLEIYTQSKKSLEQKKRPMAFLALDVVGSTEMKRGEDPGIVERDFRKFRHLVEQIIADNNALKSAWTPDGAMTCFASVPEAVQSAQTLLKKLEEFNRQIKTLRTDFAVRIGIHSGEILFDEMVLMEDISDLAIDVAGHLQKHGSPNSIYLTQETLNLLGDRQGFQPTGRVIDGHAVYEWRKDS